MTKYSKLLSCWHKLEHFSPATLPKGQDIHKLEHREPWAIPLQSSDPKKKTLEYTIYIGIFDSKHVTEFVKEYFNDTGANENERSSLIHYASIKLDQLGNYINETLGISTLPWALSQLENDKINSNHWNSDFENLIQDITQELDDIFYTINYNENDELVKKPKPLTYSTLNTIQSIIEEQCAWSVHPEKLMRYKVVEKFIPKKNAKTTPPQSDLLNSFYIKDLEKIIQEFDPEKPSKPFLNYLKGNLNEQSNRIDIRSNIDALQKSLTPKNYPDGCWPAKYNLSLMQQFAVNTTVNNLIGKHQDGIFSVNGPPGTGKTTLLRDIIAANIVNRAKVLINIKDPKDGFKKVGYFDNGGDFKYYIYQPNDELASSGMVIASSNNGAVENISKELPLKEEVQPFDQEINYFRSVAEEAFGDDYWGILSAVLGNSANRKEFVNSLWNTWKDNKPEEVGLRKYLKENKKLSLDDWKSVVTEFQNKVREITTEKNRLEKIKDEYQNFKKIIDQKNSCEEEVNKIKELRSNLENKCSKQQKFVNELKELKKEALKELESIQKSKPGFFTYWLNSKIRKAYKESYTETLHSFNEVSKNFKQENNELISLKEALEKSRNRCQIANAEFHKLTDTYDILSKKTEKAKEELKNNYADDQFWKNIETKETQEACPWYSNELKTLQSELFILSLKVNEIFLLTANNYKSLISSTLHGFFEYLKGNSTVEKRHIKAMWDTFFMVVPIVSSTFASFQTMFKDIEKEELPWLFIDEAGQAVPQAASGAIWRSQRVAIVGDPFQIEPVVTIPEIITNHLSKYFELTSDHIHTELSVQVMADRINPIGSYINIRDKDIWIGIPLRVHRRCLNPMFDIANGIAYDNTMFLSTNQPKYVDIKFQSQFIDCPGEVKGRHFVATQAEVIANILIEEVQYKQDFPDVFIITPFSEISRELRKHLKSSILFEIRQIKPQVTSSEIQGWLNTHIGTVHTFQGKQAEGVILCLGLDEKTKGAATWASQKPNLLNVALTRAKYRFIAIGDKNIWLKQPYFQRLKMISVDNVQA